MDVFTAQFKKYLAAQKRGNKKLAANSIKNYVSDLRDFLRWLKKTQTKKYALTIASFKSENFQAYKQTLFRQQTPTATLRRRLASLRKFGRFLVSANFVGTDPTVKLTNPPAKHLDPELIKQFRRYLQSQKLSRTTIRTYLADIKQFTQWTENKRN